MRVAHTVRASIQQGLLVIDVAVPGLHVALQVEGQEAFCSNELHQPLGQTLLTRHLLQSQHWQASPGTGMAWHALAAVSLLSVLQHGASPLYLEAIRYLLVS